jgi:hypothetical protein
MTFRDPYGSATALSVIRVVRAVATAKGKIMVFMILNRFHIHLLRDRGNVTDREQAALLLALFCEA